MFESVVKPEDPQTQIKDIQNTERFESVVKTEDPQTKTKK